MKICQILLDFFANLRGMNLMGKTSQKELCLISSWKRKLYLNASSATKFYLNPDFVAVQDFRGRMKIQPQLDASYKNWESCNSNIHLHNIAEILNFISNQKEQVKEFICKTKVTEVKLCNGWNYISCSNCARKMEKSQTSLTCTNCHDSKGVGILRFRIEVMAYDGSDTTTFVIFDREARKITKTTASTLMKADERHKITPACILDIFGKAHKFQVQENSDTESTQGSRITMIKNIKIEDTSEETDHEKLDKGTVKCRRLVKKKTNQQVLEDLE